MGTSRLDGSPSPAVRDTADVQRIAADAVASVAVPPPVGSGGLG